MTNPNGIPSDLASLLAGASQPRPAPAAEPSWRIVASAPVPLATMAPAPKAPAAPVNAGHVLPVTPAAIDPAIARALDVYRAAAAPSRPPELAGSAEDLRTLRAQIERMRQENEALKAAPGRKGCHARKAPAAPRVEIDPHGKGNVVIYGWRAARPVSLWPSQIDSLAGGLDASTLKARGLDFLASLVAAARHLPRRGEE